MIPEWLPLNWVSISISVVVVLYAYLTWNYDYWKKRNIPFVKPALVFGNYTDVFLGKTTVGELMENLYWAVEGKPFVGFWRLSKPGLLIREPELIKDVLAKDFGSFEENGFTVDPHLDPLLSKNPFFQKGEKWKSTRSILTPNFTKGKLKPLYPLMQEVSSELLEYLRKTDPGSDGFEAKDLCSKYTMEMVAMCGFGIKGNSFVDPNADLRRITKKLLEPGLISSMLFLILTIWPTLGYILKVRGIPKEADTFYRKLVSDVVSHRLRTGTTRNDYLQNLINLKKKSAEIGQAYDDEDITAHTVTFLTDGFETSSIVLAFCMHDLAVNSEFQEGIRREIADARQAENGELTYETLLELPLLDSVLQETLRLHSPLMAMEKVCTRDTTLRAPDGTAVRVSKGMTVVVPSRALHTDPRFFESPQTFDPDRWSPERREQITKYSYLPFGEGPRMCLGMRFAILQIKLALASVLENFEIKTTPKTPEVIVQDVGSFLTAAKGGLWVKCTPLKAN